MVIYINVKHPPCQPSEGTTNIILVNDHLYLPHTWGGCSWELCWYSWDLNKNIWDSLAIERCHGRYVTVNSETARFVFPVLAADFTKKPIFVNFRNVCSWYWSWYHRFGRKAWSDEWNFCYSTCGWEQPAWTSKLL